MCNESMWWNFQSAVWLTAGPVVHNRNKTTKAIVPIKVIVRRVRVTIVAVKQQKSVTYSECVYVALGIKHAVRVRRVILSSPSYLGSIVFLYIISYMLWFSGKSYCA